MKLQLIPAGAIDKLRGFQPQHIKLAADQPSSFKKGTVSKSALFGTIPFGGVKRLIVVDEPDEGDAMLYLDANGNGDITDDPAITWKKEDLVNPDGVRMIQYSGDFKLPLGNGEKAPLVRLAAYRFDKNDPKKARHKMNLYYMRDYVLDGEITIAGSKYHAMLTDEGATGDFTGKSAAADAIPRLCIDLNNDGRFQMDRESFEVSKAFEIGGTVWKFVDLTSDGSFKLVPSEAPTKN